MGLDHAYKVNRTGLPPIGTLFIFRIMCGQFKGSTMPKQAFRWTNSPQNFHFSGPEALRAYFFPRQTVQIQEAARIIGVGREAMYRGSVDGLRFSRRPSGRQFILLDDLIFFVFPSNPPESPEIPGSSSESYTNGVTEGKKPGRPRGSKNKTKVPAPFHPGGAR